MALVTRTISNAGSPLTDVNGGLLANTVIRFTLVNDRSYAAGTFDVETGEPVAPGPYVAITDEAGLFSVALWPTSRGLEQRFYLCEIAPQSDTVDFPAFKAPLAEDADPISFLAFRLGGDAVAEWETTAFTAHVENSAIHGGGGSANIYYQPEPPASPTDGTAWIDSDETGGQFPITVNADWNATSGLAEILNKPTFGTAAAVDSTDFAPATHDHDADYEPSGAVAGHESTYNHSLLHAPGSDDQDLSGYSLNTHGHDADYEAAGEVAAHELAFDHTQLHTHGQALETTDSPEFADVTITGLTGAVIGTAPTVGEALTAIDHMLTITGDAVTSHTGLAGRSLPDQHPISAISGLQAALDAKAGAGNVAFPETQVPSSDPNTLDDYEEGTFTATLIGAFTPPTNPVTTTGYYTKIGRVVFINIAFTNVDTSGAGGTIQISGLPFNASANTIFIGSALLYGFGSAVAVSRVSSGDTIFLLNAVTLATIPIVAGTGKTLYVSLQYNV